MSTTFLKIVSVVFNNATYPVLRAEQKSQRHQVLTFGICK